MIEDAVRLFQTRPAARRPRRPLPSAMAGLLLTLLLTAACTTGQPAGPGEFNDPYEGTNRRIHDFNKGVDRALYRPASTAYGTVIPRPVRRVVVTFSQNIDLPRQVVNDILQGQFEDAGHNAFRFAVNATLGLFGLFDPASGLGLEPRESDFGETLHVWGVGEGAYVAVPFFGPSTQRDLTGDVVDLFTNPISYILSPPESFYGPAASVGENADYRYTFRDTLNQVLDESADSYAQSRLIYLDARRFELRNRNAGRGGPQAAGVVDPLADDGFVDPYGDTVAGAPAAAPAQPAAVVAVDPYEELYGD